MSMMNPAQMKFESQSDVIDYVTKGCPPRRKDFDALMGAIEHREEESPNHVTIAPGIEFDMDDDALVLAMNRVYQNRCHNRRILIGAGIVVGALVFAGGMHQHNRIKDLEHENDRLSQIIEEDLPVVNISQI